MIPVIVAVTSLRGGGAERRVLEIVERLDRSRWAPHLFLANREGELLDRVPPDVPVLAPPASLRWTRAIPGLWSAVAAWGLAGAVRATGARVVLSRISTMNAIAWAAAHFSGRRSMVRIIMTEASDPESFGAVHRARFSALRRWLLRRAYRGADRVVALGESLAKNLVKHYSIDMARVTVIPNGVDMKSVERLAKEEPPHVPGEGPLLVTFAGNSDEKLHIKGVATIVEALAAVRAEFPARLAIVGTKVGHPRVTEWAVRHGVEDAVHCTGFLEHPNALLRAADLFVMASLFEGAPMALLEAMACGTPVVAADAPGGIAEIAGSGDRAELVKPDGASSLAAGIVALLRDPARAATLSNAARKAAREEYDLDGMVAAYDALLADEIHAGDSS